MYTLNQTTWQGSANFCGLLDFKCMLLHTASAWNYGQNMLLAEKMKLSSFTHK